MAGDSERKAAAACRRDARQTALLLSVCVPVLLLLLLLLLLGTQLHSQHSLPGQQRGSAGGSSAAATATAATAESGYRSPLLLTFAHNCCTAATKRCCAAALAHGFASCQVAGLADCELDLLSPAGRAILGNGSSRGAGYWLWKPLLIMQTLLQAPEGAVVMYSDAGAQFVSHAGPLLALLDRQDVVGFELPCCKEGAWTKPDALVLLDAAHLANTQQVLASYILFRRSPVSLGFVSSWLAHAQDTRALTDAPSTLQRCVSNATAGPAFRDHRHDQSIFSLLYKQYGFKAFPLPSQFGGKGKARRPYPQIIHHHRDLS